MRTMASVDAARLANVVKQYNAKFPEAKVQLEGTQVVAPTPSFIEFARAQGLSQYADSAAKGLVALHATPKAEVSVPTRGVYDFEGPAEKKAGLLDAISAKGPPTDYQQALMGAQGLDVVQARALEVLLETAQSPSRSERERLPSDLRHTLESQSSMSFDLMADLAASWVKGNVAPGAPSGGGVFEGVDAKAAPTEYQQALMRSQGLNASQAKALEVLLNAASSPSSAEREKLPPELTRTLRSQSSMSFDLMADLAAAWVRENVR
jgi:hypothetical protein